MKPKIPPVCATKIRPKTKLEFPGKPQLKSAQKLEKAGNFFRPHQAVFWQKPPFYANFALYANKEKGLKSAEKMEKAPFF